MLLNDLLKRKLAGKKNGRNNAGGGAVIHLFWATKRGIFQWLLNRIVVTFLFIHVVWYFKRVFRERKKKTKEISASELLKYFIRLRPHESGRFRIPILGGPLTSLVTGGGSTQQMFIRESSAFRSSPLPSYIPFFNPFRIPSIELCILFNCCKCTVF